MNHNHHVKKLISITTIESIVGEGLLNNLIER